MKTLHLSNDRGRNARVRLNTVSSREQTRYVSSEGNPVRHARLLKHTTETNLAGLLQRYGDLEGVANALVEGDPEVDLRSTGKMIRRTRRVVLGKDQKPAFSFQELDVVRNPSGEVVKREPAVRVEANVDAESPVAWSGKAIPKREAFRKFAFVRTYQVTHVDGLTYDFLYEMAKKLHEQDAMMLVGSRGGKGPLVFTAGQPPYRGFLEGRVEGDSYMLLLHLTSIELKPVKEV